MRKTTLHVWIAMLFCLIAVLAEAVRAAEPAPPAAAARAAETYSLGAGDTVRITVYNNPDMTTETQIAEDGSISFPLLGRVVLAGMGKSAAEKNLGELLTSGGFLRTAQVNLQILEYRSQQVLVLGEVGKPGKYPIGPTETITDVIAQAGGITEKGSQTITVIRRVANGEQKNEQIDLRTLLASNGQVPQLHLSAQDVVYVPPMPVFYIYGEVNKPGSYPLESGLTVRQAISLGGGLTVRGTERGIRISRKDAKGATQNVKADLGDAVQPGDVVRIKESMF